MHGTIFVCRADPFCFVSGHLLWSSSSTATVALYEDMYSQWEYYLVMDVSEANKASGKQANVGRLRKMQKSAETPVIRCAIIACKSSQETSRMERRFLPTSSPHQHNIIPSHYAVFVTTAHPFVNHSKDPPTITSYNISPFWGFGICKMVLTNNKG